MQFEQKQGLPHCGLKRFLPPTAKSLSGMWQYAFFPQCCPPARLSKSFMQAVPVCLTLPTAPPACRIRWLGVAGVCAEGASWGVQ
eukprot:2394805-Alexandrium_andersonii.AAC.1